MKADVQYADYPYSKFNVKIEAVNYSDDEYYSLLSSTSWTKSETDLLMHICYLYDLRWPVIVDRYTAIPPRTSEELQQRYYEVITKVKASRAMAGESSLRNEAHTVFDFVYERNRRIQQALISQISQSLLILTCAHYSTQQDMLFRKTKIDEIEETQLKEELKAIDAALKKLKKPARPGVNGGLASNSQSSSVSIVTNFGDGNKGSLITMAPTTGAPLPGKPALQSGRLIPMSYSAGLSKTLCRKAQSVLSELGMPENPIPTRNVCDLVDQVRRDTVALLGLESILQRKEKELVSLSGSNSTISAASSGAGSTLGLNTSASGMPTHVDIKKEKGVPDVVVPHSMVTTKGSDYIPAPALSYQTVLPPSTATPVTSSQPKKAAPKRKANESDAAGGSSGKAANVNEVALKAASKPPPAKRAKK